MSKGPKKSRLEKLISLLEESKDRSTLESAAQKIKDVVCQHPQQLPGVLDQVQRVLRSQCWDARVSAAEALAHIAGVVAHYSPEQLAKEGGNDAEAADQGPHDLLSSFNVSAVLQRDSLSASNAQLQAPSETQQLGSTARERAHALQQRLGLYSTAQTGESSRGVPEHPPAQAGFPDKDSGSSNSEEQQDADQLQAAAAGGTATLSGKGCKRRACTEASQPPRRQKASKEARPAAQPSSEHGTNGHVALDCSGEDDWIAAGGWPFQLFADQLLSNLLHPSWEVRHGATLGLQAILRHHAACAAVQVQVAEPLTGWHRPGGTGRMQICPVSFECVSAAYQQRAAWLQDAIGLLLCVLLLDRFADYTGDQVTAPVREAAAQALALAALPLPVAQRLQLLQLLVSMQTSPLWEVRHGAMLAIKYLLATNHTDSCSLMPTAMPALMAALHEGDDDVRAAAAHACAPLVATIFGMGGDFAAKLTECLWSILPELGDISAATQSVLQLLGALYSTGGDGATGSAAVGDPVDLQAKLVSLWPFMQHTLPEVQAETCSCIRRICSRLFSHQEFSAHASAPTLSRLLHLTYQTLLTTAHTLVASAAAELLHFAAAACPAPALAAALGAQLIQTLAGLPCLALLEPLPREYRFALDGTPSELESAGNTSGQLQTQTFAMIAGGDAAAVVGAQVRCAEVLAALMAACAACSGHPACQLAASNMQNLMGTFLQQQSATMQTFAALVYFFWLLPQECPPRTAPAAVHDQLHAALAHAPQLALQELSAPLHAVLAALASVFTALADAETPAELPEGVALDAVDAAYAATVLEAIAPAVPADDAHPVAVAHAAAVTAVARLEDEAAVLRCRLCAVLAAAAAAWREPPARVTALVQPLIAAVRRLPASPLHERVFAPAMAELMLACATRTPCPNGKILKHIVSIARAAAAPPDADSHPPTPATGSPPPGLLTSASSSLSSGTLVAVAPTAGQPHGGGQDAVAHASAEGVLRYLVRRAGAELAERVPQLWARMTEPVAAIGEAEAEAGQDDVGQLLTAARVLACTARELHADLHARLALQLRSWTACLVRLAGSPAATVVAESLAALAEARPQAHLEPLVAAASTLLDAERAAADRRAGVALLSALLDPSRRALAPALLPYGPLVTAPALACMSDPLPDVRVPTAAAFGRLVALLPLAPRGAALPPTPSLPADIRARRAADATLLDQLSETSRVAPFEPPVAPAGVTLRGYQRDGVAWLAFLRRFGLHGVLADDMGLGKTLQTLTIVAAAVHDSRAAHAPAAPSLVVCPASLVGHWVAEAERYYGHAGLTPVALQSGAARRAAVQARLARGGPGLLVVASYDTVRAGAAWLAQCAFEYCVLDEGHTIRNPRAKVSQACKQIVARHRLLLTGTPIQNSARELWALFDFLMPGLLGAEATFSARFRTAAAPAGRGTARQPPAAQQAALAAALDDLHQQVLPFILRRTKEQVLQDLPPKLMQDIFCDLSPLQQTLYDGAVSSQKAGEWAAAAGDTRAVGGSGDTFEMLNFLRKLCSHPRLAVDWQRPDHAAAVRAALPAERTRTAEAALDALSHVSHSPKLLALQQLLTECGVLRGDGGADTPPPESAHRVLVFAQLRGTLDLVETAVLAPAGVSFVRLDGGVRPSERHAVVQRFNADPTIDVMLLTTAVGGLGLNLTAADTVVFLEHDWNPMKDLQAMDRAHRLGQKKVVTVYRLLMRGTLEERIMSLQQFKTDVAAAVVNTDNVATDSMATGGVLDLVGASANVSANGAQGTVSDKAELQREDASLDAFLKRVGTGL